MNKKPCIGQMIGIMAFCAVTVLESDRCLYRQYWSNPVGNTFARGLLEVGRNI